VAAHAKKRCATAVPAFACNAQNAGGAGDEAVKRSDRLSFGGTHKHMAMVVDEFGTIVDW